MRQPRLRTVLTGAGATLALIGGSTAAYAVSAGPIDSSGVIHGCYKTTATANSHAVVLQDAGTACASGYTAIRWNQKGPTGPQGPAGPTGPQGPPGPAGPGATAIDTFVQAGSSVNIATVGAFTVNASCEPSGNPNTLYLTLTPENGPYNATGWVSASGSNGATPQLISDTLAGGALQYSAQAGSAIDEHVTVLDYNSAPGPVTFDLQMTSPLFVSTGIYECEIWGTAIPST